MTWKAKAEHSLYFDGTILRIAHLRDDKVSEVTDITMTDRHCADASTTPPPLSGADAISFMQAVMDAAYDYGLRPSASQDERHMKAHLEDMRSIAFHTLKMTKK